MIRHTDLGATSYARLRSLAKLIKCETVTLGGHQPGKIYGRLTCRTGKRMKAENRVFFRDQPEAIALGYRPCALCMPEAYKVWKAS
ncbi:Ada metal-binding domain-containing protein [Spirosoma sp. KNUC1025]|uniref:Ada metal-binding domain-containing protein n=1 Tax=Spirosoma sp. KNUC1025 TaxID=2894082 RepID=UPI00386F3ECE|nr:metal-binding protein [Spirosoma sp. KNUC1025]